MVYAQPRIRLGNKSISREHPHYGIIKIGQNTEKSPVDLGRLAVAQTPVKNHQLTLVWKTLKGVNNYYINHNTENSPGNMKRIFIIQTSVNDSQQQW